ncbi:glutamate ABC transporter substrate-binding protein [Catenuloplanes japonicus]|uniref:glutamate ABC transporter substrate-binding protein n=1 Tax=Catenuloplanes japonicus TaxID=33876 RepID=UPI0005262E59|nr:glutamate ABC transporter substrate-binding protein [Catenuloplanes japonicus]
MRMRLLATAAVMMMLAGCGPVPAEEPEAAVSARVPVPVNVKDPAASLSPAPSPPACVPRQSLRPEGALPAPGRMPDGSTMAEIVQRGRLRVGIDQNAYLFGFRDPDTGELSGFEIDLGKEIARAIFGDAEAVQFRAITTADRIPVLERGDVDIVIRTMTMTCERWQQVNFSTEYLTSRQRLLVNKGSGIGSFDDLGGRKVCATAGSTSIRKIVEQPSGPVPVSTDSTLDCLVLLQQGQVDAVSTIDVLLAALAAQDRGTEIVGPGITEEPSGIGIPLGDDDLVRFVNGVLERARTDGTWKRIYERWLLPLGPAPAPPAAQYRT